CRRSLTVQGEIPHGLSRSCHRSANGYACLMNIPESFRALKWHEVVRAGDYVADVLLGGLKRREGLCGFRADTYVTTVYRKRNVRRDNK
ncbi:MAG TPA: hypothetical protein VK327_15325, partial [Candidatus Paceibacterota bacterium]|nr:hypothetical protein [Candidatus Paceibacterota bacterium]